MVAGDMLLGRAALLNITAGIPSMKLQLRVKN